MLFHGLWYLASMDPLHLSIALGPLSVYLMLLGAINLSKRPFMTTGARDTAALGVAVAGFAVAGPMELFLPERAVARFGPWVWVLLLSFYALTLLLIVLLMRPRLVIYNITAEQLRPLLSEVVQQLDTEHRWAGESLVLPKLHVQLHLESFGPLRNAQLVSTGPQQSYAGWRTLEIALAERLHQVNGVPNPYGFSLLGFGILIIALVTFWTINDTENVNQALNEMLRR